MGMNLLELSIQEQFHQYYGLWYVGNGTLLLESFLHGLDIDISEKMFIINAENF